jgi:hypothetical protein
MGEVNNNNWSKLFDGLDSILSLLEGGVMSEIDDAGVRNSYWLKLLNKLNDIMTVIAGGRIYSTEERIVGKWIDDKPVYQKTFIGTITASASVEVIISLLDVVDSFVGGEGFYGTGTGDNGSGIQIPGNNSAAYGHLQKNGPTDLSFISKHD